MILLIMLTVGLGLASPYLLLSWKPGWLRFLPKPGPWMARFKVAMGFPMLAAAMWLLSLVAVHYGERTWWLAGFLVVLGFAMWVYGEFVQRGSKRRWLGWAVAVGLALLGYQFLFEGGFRWRQPLQESDRSAEVPAGVDHLPWQPWSPQAVADARAQGRPVLVDFTARWCITCQVNKAVLESSSVRAKVQATRAVTLLADYTRQRPEITAELNRFGRAAVPMVLIYPADSQRPPAVFDSVTPGAVLNALGTSGS
jgi:thiol:disulfide interchange protein DsbD